MKTRILFSLALALLVAGGATAQYSPDGLPRECNMLMAGCFDPGSDEFDNDFEETWRWGNQDGASDTWEYDGATIATTDDDALEWHFRWLDAPTAGTDFMVAAKMSVTAARIDAQGFDFFTNGIGMLMEGSEASPTEITRLALVAGDDAIADINAGIADDYQRTNFSNLAEDAGSAEYTHSQRPIYFVMRWDATAETVTFAYSLVGIDWNILATQTFAGLDPISVGRFSGHRNILPPPRAHFHWFRVITEATKIANLEVGEG